MKAVVIEEHGGLDKLVIKDVPTPEPGPREVRVAVRAVALNHLDTWVRRGVPGHPYPLPLIPGCDVAGVVDALGPGVDDIVVGDEVVISPGLSCGVCMACLSGRDHNCRKYGIVGETRDGGCAEFIVIPRANIIPKPASLPFDQVVAIPLTFLTAWAMLVDRAQLKPGETVLVQAAGSGVGVAAIQIARLFEATVIATAGSDAKLAKARELGAAHTINYRTQDVAKEVAAITGKRGVQIVVDHVGADTFASSMKALAWQGRLVMCGATSGVEVKLNLAQVFFKALSILGSTMGSKADTMRIIELAGRGVFKPVIDRVLPLDQVAEGHRALEARETFGKIVLTVP